MVVTELIKIKNDVYTYEYRPWDKHTRGEFTVNSKAELLEVIELAEDDKHYRYFSHAIAGVRDRFKTEGKLPQQDLRIWL